MIVTLQERLPMLLKGLENPQKLPLPLEESGLHLIHGSLGPPESTPSPKRHLDWFSCFCRAPEHDQQTDRQTDHATPSVAIDRCH